MVELAKRLQAHATESIERRGWQLADEYVDIRISGTKKKRLELDRLMADAHRRRFDCVVVWKFDHFARSVSHLLRVPETFKAQGIEFVFFSEQMDTSTPAGKMVFTVLGAVAALERSLMVAPVKAGCETTARRASGLDGLGVSWIFTELPCCGRRAWVGRESRENWGLGPEHSIGSLYTVANNLAGQPVESSTSRKKHLSSYGTMRLLW
jgi:hypothetical protein